MINYDDRNMAIYRMRAEEGKRFREIGEQFNISAGRANYIFSKIKDIKDTEERKLAADPKTMGAIDISTRLLNVLYYEYDSLFKGAKIDSVPVIDFLERISKSELMKLPNVGKKTIKEFALEAKKVVGKRAVDRWLMGRPPNKISDDEDLVELARHNAKADMPHHESVELIEKMADRIEALNEELDMLTMKLHSTEASFEKERDYLSKKASMYSGFHFRLKDMLDTERNLNLLLDKKVSIAEDFGMWLERSSEQSGDSFLLESSRNFLDMLKK